MEKNEKTSRIANSELLSYSELFQSKTGKNSKIEISALEGDTQRVFTKKKVAPTAGPAHKQISQEHEIHTLS